METRNLTELNDEMGMEGEGKGNAEDDSLVSEMQSWMDAGAFLWEGNTETKHKIHHTLLQMLLD